MGVLGYTYRGYHRNPGRSYWADITEMPVRKFYTRHKSALRHWRGHNKHNPAIANYNMLAAMWKAKKLRAAKAARTNLRYRILAWRTTTPRVRADRAERNRQTALRRLAMTQRRERDRRRLKAWAQQLRWRNAKDLAAKKAKGV